ADCFSRGRRINDLNRSVLYLQLVDTPFLQIFKSPTVLPGPFFRECRWSTPRAGSSQILGKATKPPTRNGPLAAKSAAPRNTFPKGYHESSLLPVRHLPQRVV